MAKSMLRVERLRKSFGGVVATDQVSIDFPAESLTAVIGPNGAGKTTFFNLITGAIRPDEGDVWLDGENIVGCSESEIVKKGIGRAFQVAKLFASLTVEESLRGALQSPLGRSLQMHGSFPLQQTRDRAFEVMEQLGLDSKATTVAGNFVARRSEAPRYCPCFGS